MWDERNVECGMWNVLNPAWFRLPANAEGWHAGGNGVSSDRRTPGPVYQFGHTSVVTTIPAGYAEHRIFLRPRRRLVVDGDYDGV